MSQLVKRAGGRKAFGFYIFILLSTGLFALQGPIGTKIGFAELTGFWELIFFIYAGANVAHFIGKERSQQKQQSNEGP
jgi:hypothetical protein